MIDGRGDRRVVLLGRVSRGERQQDPESQTGPLRAAADRLGWTVVEVVLLTLSAWDTAAATEVRRRALAPIEEGRADTLMVWAWDRYSREGIEGAFRELRHLEEHLGAAFYSLREPFLNTATADKAQRELLLSMIAWCARWESQRKSDRVRAKAQSKRARAASLGERAVWGAGHLASDADIERIWALAAAGRSVRAIAAEVGISKSQIGRLLDKDH